MQDTLTPAGANRARIDVAGPAIRPRPHAALAISLALHELFTNALKHGALFNEAGRVSLPWRHLDSDGKLRIMWREAGGPPVVAPRHRGFGSLLLEQTLVRDLAGRVTLAFKAQGVVCVIEMPVTDAGGRACLG